MAKRPPKPELTPDLTDASRGQRIQKVLAGLGVASRRACEELIAAGRVSVNGELVTTLPAWVDPQQDRIAVDGQVVTRPKRLRSSSRKVYVILNKPRRVISTASDPEGRQGVLDLVQLPPPLPQRLFPVGRLDADSTGLILLTNDGELANRLTHPRYEVPKQYHVSIKGRLSDEDVESLKQGLYLARRGPGGGGAGGGGAEGSGPRGTGGGRRERGAAGEDSDTHRGAGAARKAKISQVQLLGQQQDRAREDRSELLITLQEGQNREIRRMLARLGFKVRRLQRVAIGPISVKGLALGEWRLLTSGEVRKLKQAAGMRDERRRPR